MQEPVLDKATVNTLVEGDRCGRMEPSTDPIWDRLYGEDPSVALEVVETHDGSECDCIEQSSRTLKVGDTLELHHVCVDGRVDVIRATVKRING